MLPKISESPSSKLWIIPSELTEALKGIGTAFTPKAGPGSSTPRWRVTHPYFVKAEQPRILAHRGLVTVEGRESGVWENTAAAFAAAHAAGAEYIETDCQITADGDVVLFHDHDLRRLVDDPRPVHEVRTRELSALFAEHGGLLTVAEALSAFPETRFNIDVKTPAAAAPLGPVLAAHTHRVLVTSFSDANRRATVEAVRQTGTGLRPATSGGSRTIAALRTLSAMRLSPAGCCGRSMPCRSRSATGRSQC